MCARMHAGRIVAYSYFQVSTQMFRYKRIFSLSKICIFACMSVHLKELPPVWSMRAALSGTYLPSCLTISLPVSCSSLCPPPPTPPPLPSPFIPPPRSCR